MNVKPLFILFMRAMPILAGLWFGLSIVLAPSHDAASEKAGEAITHFAIPWWIKAIEFVAPVPIIGTVGVLGIILYVVLKRNGTL